MTGLVEKKEWPIWANVLIGLLIGMAIIWIPLIWLLRFDMLVEMQCFDGRSHLNRSHSVQWRLFFSYSTSVSSQ